MFIFKHRMIFIAGLLIFLCTNAWDVKGQASVLSDTRYDSILLIRKQKALDMLNKEDTTSTSAFWPHIKPALFFANVRMNIMYPDKINQGLSTNFCGYAALTHLLLKYHPETYLQNILSLYRTGKVSLTKKTLAPSDAVRQAAGTLQHKGELDVLDANQLWFLTLADQFKGYINIFDHSYKPGDENKIWAGSNYGKFNRMLEDFTDDTLIKAGSDFLRPFKNDFYEYISTQLQSGIVLLYVNSKYLYAHKFTLFKLRAPTHFIVLYNMYKVDDLIETQYWDYGLKTEQLISKKRLRKLIFGVTTITHTSHEIH
jgi:hypothetical protein